MNVIYECGKCGRPIEKKDAGLCEPCWRELFEEDQADAQYQPPQNIYYLEHELPF